ncbi:PAS domain-containing sensor histidine kinase [Lutibacter sp. A80]|uniref:PAS domain-containing sensor histidine kinase n=1 Tax=Lutibacter sp. A80 TaxID=2918453 RepID=UPI001F06E2E9|nr:PAS domain-containing sensor histidine kinase [Lutibacter sp. A80]UMB60784.1 PAS domain-containing sensor histidine kinase [Lutibacter sp. A80]
MSLQNPILDNQPDKRCNNVNYIELNDVPDKGVVICDKAGAIITANNYFCELIISNLNKLEGKCLEPELFSNIGSLKNTCNFKQLLEGTKKRYEFQIVKKDATVVFIEVKAKKVAGNNVAYFFKDISEQRILNLELQELTHNLEISNQDKSRFIAVLAHDLINPFNSILGFITLLKSNLKTASIDTIEKYVNYIEAASQNTYNLLEDTLGWIRSENGNLTVHKGTHEINSLVIAVVKNYKANSNTKNISIHFEEEEKMYAFCDANMIKIVLRNLLSNAIKFTNKNGEIHITITTSAKETKIAIKDNGIGISKKLQAQLFSTDRVHRRDGTAQEKGTGMGLLLCKEFINKHNGKLYVTSKEGVGSTFTFTIPKVLEELNTK